MNQSPPIFVASLFPELHEHLIALLRSLSAEDWHRPTSSSQRNVKDIAAHLLDGSVRRLSMQRDGYLPPDSPQGFGSHQELMEYLHRLNADWTQAMRRLSPRVLVQWLDETGREFAELMQQLDPDAPALFSVAWAGETASANWFDIAREYTEKWHHTQQIFQATGRPSTITSRRLFHPCLDTFMRALPLALKDATAAEGTTVAVIICGEAGGRWVVCRQRAKHEGPSWVQLFENSPSEDISPAATVTLDQLTAWQLFTKRHRRQHALSRFPEIELTGDVALGGHVLEMVAMMA